MLQWGRVLMNAKTEKAPSPDCFNGGRVLMNAETSILTPYPLQWGRVLMNAETQPAAFSGGFAAARRFNGAAFS